MVKWTSDLDQVLLIKVLEACEVRPTSKEFEHMAKTWPDHLERPTARAISEHLFIIKKNAKATMGDKGDKSAKSGSEKSTPKKAAKITRKATPAKIPTKGKGGAEGKRKRMKEEDEESSGEMSDDVELAVKKEESDDAFDDGSQMSQTTKKSHTVPNSSQQFDEAGLMYDGAYAI